MNLRIDIKITNTDDDRVLWTDWSSGDDKNLRGMFESAEEILGKMERHLPKVIEEDGSRFHDMGDFDEDHEDDVAGVGDEPEHGDE